MSKLKRTLEEVHLCEMAFRNGMKYNELTWQDIKRIVKIADDLIPCTPFASVSEQIFADEFQTEQSYYEEVLKRFKEGKPCGPR